MKMDLFQASCQADELCLVYCKCQANLYLGCDNAVLVRLVTKTNREHIVWMDASLSKQGVYSYARAFHEFQEDAEDDLGDIKFSQEIQPDEDVFCYNGSVYYLYAAISGNSAIRRIRAYCSQSVVEAIERTEEKEPIEAIYLVNFYLYDGKRRNYAFTGWGVAYQNGCNYLPVFDEDRHYVEEYLLSAFIREELPVGTIFKNNGYYYKVMQDEKGKLCLEYSKVLFTLGKTANERSAPPEKPKAKVFYVDFKSVANK